MKIMSRLALATALAAGTMMAQPVLAKDKQAAAAPGPKFSPAFLKVAKPAQDAVNGGDPATAEPLVAQAEAAATTDDDKYVSAQMRYIVEAKKIRAAQTANPGAAADNTPLVKPLDALIANPVTPQADRARFYFTRAQIAYQGKQYPVAIDYFSKARELGSTEVDLPIFIVEAKVFNGDVNGGLADLNAAVDAKTAKGEKVPDEWYRFAISQSNKRHQTQQTVDWIARYVAAYPTPKTWNESLVTYGLASDGVAKLDAQQKIDLYRLMRYTNSLADQYSYLDYAQKAQAAGLPTEALAVLKEGIASGKIPAGNTEAKAMLSETANQIKLEGSLAGLEAKARGSGTGALASQTADAYLGAGDNAKAVDLYKLALSKGGVDADLVNTRLGVALARSGDKAGAAAAFANVHGGSRANIAQLWTVAVKTPAAA